MTISHYFQLVYLK